LFDAGCFIHVEISPLPVLACPVAHRQILDILRAGSKNFSRSQAPTQIPDEATPHSRIGADCNVNGRRKVHPIAREGLHERQWVESASADV
jgi:hypothetical protein